MANDVEHLFMCLFAIYAFFDHILIKPVKSVEKFEEHYHLTSIKVLGRAMNMYFSVYLYFSSLLSFNGVLWFSQYKLCTFRGIKFVTKHNLLYSVDSMDSSKLRLKIFDKMYV
jgi:hypothetical protein